MLTKILTIKDRYKNFKPAIKIEAWKYWEVVDILRTNGVGREESYAAAKWASDNRSKGTCPINIPDLILMVQ